MDLKEIVNLIKVFKESVLPSGEFHNSKKIKVQKAVGSFNTKHCLQKRLFVHFEKVGESTLYTWKKVNLGKQGPTILEKIATKGGFETRQNLSPLKNFFKTETNGIQGELFP